MTPERRLGTASTMGGQGVAWVEVDLAPRTVPRCPNMSWDLPTSKPGLLHSCAMVSRDEATEAGRGER